MKIVPRLSMPVGLGGGSLRDNDMNEEMNNNYRSGSIDCSNRIGSGFINS